MKCASRRWRDGSGRIDHADTESTRLAVAAPLFYLVFDDLFSAGGNADKVGNVASPGLSLRWLSADRPESRPLAATSRRAS